MSLSWIVFFVGTAGIAVFSWRFSIRSGRYHGVARFFAFESLLALFLLNRPYWFERPGTALHLLSWLFLFVSLGLAGFGARQLFRRGRPEGQLENTTRLVTTGLFRFIRHPLYASLFYFGLGIWLKSVTPDDVRPGRSGCGRRLPDGENRRRRDESSLRRRICGLHEKDQAVCAFPFLKPLPVRP